MFSSLRVTDGSEEFAEPEKMQAQSDKGSIIIVSELLQMQRMAGLTGRNAATFAHGQGPLGAAHEGGPAS